MRPTPENPLESHYREWRTRNDTVAQLRKVFVVGQAKSGTTWVQCLLHGHREIVLSGEGGYARKLIPTLAKAFDVYNNAQKVSGLENVTIDPAEQLCLIRQVLDSRLASYLRTTQNLGNVRVVGDKTPEHALYVETLGKVYPTAQFISVIRDPRDGATSGWFHLGKRENLSLEQYVQRYFQGWKRSILTARQQARAVHGTNLERTFLEVRYEDLHADPDATVRRLLRFLSVDDSKASVDACLKAGDFRRLSGGRSRGEKKNDNFWRNGLVGDWQNHLPLELAESCCATVAKLMHELGYDCGTPASAPAA